MPAIKDAIDCMSTAERVQTMEYLWSVLSSYYDSEVPEWHANVLAERENASEDEFEEREDTKKKHSSENEKHKKQKRKKKKKKKRKKNIQSTSTK